MSVTPEQARKNSTALTAAITMASLEGNMVAGQGADYVTDVGSPQDGKWYAVRDCPKCGDATPYFEDPTKGGAANFLDGMFTLHTNCPSCGADVSATKDSLSSIQWPSR